MTSLKITCTGYNIEADWYEGQATNKVLLNLYGYSSNKSRQKELTEAVVAGTGRSVLIFDYSGHGDSPFQIETTRPAQHFLEVIYAFDWLRSNHPEAEITVMGTSYGGFLATQLTKYRAFENLILRAPAIYKPSDFYTTWADIDRNWTRTIFRKDSEALANHPLLARASKFAGRTLVMVHQHDDSVPTQTTDAYIKTFSSDTHYAQDLHHALSDPRNPKSSLQNYYAHIIDWINQTDTQK